MNPKEMARREEAREKTNKQRKALEIIDYSFQGDDVIIDSGKWKGKSVRDLWATSAEGRDYIVEHLWNRNDDDLNSVIRTLVCR